MRSFSFRQTMVKGVMLALPLAIVFYVLVRVIGILEKLLSPLAKKAGISNIFGDITLTVIAIASLLILIFLFGLMMKLAFIANFRLYIQDVILKMVPSLNHLKLIAAEKLDIDDAVDFWKPILLADGDQFIPAYIVEESSEWMVILSIKPPSAEPDNIRIIKRSSVRYKEITMKQMMQCVKQFGKGFVNTPASLPDVQNASEAPR
jgi:hypothetical protein